MPANSRAIPGRLEIRGLQYQRGVPKLRVPPRSPARQGGDEPKLAALTRDDVPRRLGEQLHRALALGGFTVSGPTTVAETVARVGAGEYRVSAYGLELRGLRWEVFVRLGEESS